MSPVEKIKQLDVLQVITSILLTIVTTVTGWMLTTIISVGNEIAAMKADRWTSKDQSGHEAVIRAEMLDTWKAIADLKQEVVVNTQRIQDMRSKP